MRLPSPVQRNKGALPAAGLAVAIGAFALGGCATTTPVPLLQVQQRVGPAGSVAVVWPKTPEEQAQAHASVRNLLGHDLTPDISVRIAVLNNRSLRATFEELGVSEADLIQAGLLRNPIFFADARFPNQTPHAADVELSLVGDILDDILIPVRRKVARVQLDAAEDRVAQAVLDLAADVKTAAYILESRQELRSHLATLVQANDAAVELARRQFAAGNINQLALSNQEVAAEEAHLELLRVGAQVTADRETLNRLMGLSGDETDWRLSAELPNLPGSDASAENLEATARASRYDLAAAKARVATAQTAYDLVRHTRFLPAGVRLGVDSERNPDGSRVTGPSVELGLPLFDQGQAEMARAASELRRAQAGYDALSAQVGSEVRSARNALMAARTTAEYFDKTLLPTRELILRQTLLNYNAMQSSPYELLAAKEAEERAMREAVEARRDYWAARIQLERAVGGPMPPGNAP